MENRLKIVKVRALVKMLVMFTAVASLFLAIFLDVSVKSYSILGLALYLVFALVVMSILGLDTLSDWTKERESYNSDIRLEKHMTDISLLQEKFRELDGKYNVILKEVQELQQKTKTKKKKENLVS